MVIRKTCASKHVRKHVHSIDLNKSSLKSAIEPIMILVIGLAFVATSSTSATITTPTTRTIQRNRIATGDSLEAIAFGRRLGAINQPEGNSQQLVTSGGGAFGRADQPEAAANPMRIYDHNDHSYHQSSSQTDLSQADQMEEPTFATPPLDQDPVDLERTTSSVDQLDRFGELDARRRQANFNHRDNNTPNLASDNDEADRGASDGSLFTTMSNHDTQLRAMRDMFERRHLDGNNNNNNNNNQHRGRNNNRHHINDNRQQGGAPLQSSQELSPISIGLDNVSPFAMPPFQMGGMNDGGGGGAGGSPVQPPLPSMGVHMKSQMSNADNLDGGLEPTLPFGLNPLPHLMGFQSAAFDGPQRGDQSAHSNHHAAAAPQPDTEPVSGGSSQSGQKSWPKIFRFTDGRINLSDFEKQKKIRLSSKHNENHIESAPIMFDGRPLKRKSFLILHGGVFPGN